MNGYPHPKSKKPGKNNAYNLVFLAKALSLVAMLLITLTSASAQVEFRDSSGFDFYNELTLQSEDLNIENGNLTMNNNRILGLPEPNSSGEPLTYGGGSGEYVDRDGDSMTGDLDLQDNYLIGNAANLSFGGSNLEIGGGSFDLTDAQNIIMNGGSITSINQLAGQSGSAITIGSNLDFQDTYSLKGVAGIADCTSEEVLAGDGSCITPSTTLSEVLNEGNSAGSTDLDMSGQDIDQIGILNSATQALQIGDDVSLNNNNLEDIGGTDCSDGEYLGSTGCETVSTSNTLEEVLNSNNDAGNQEIQNVNSLSIGSASPTDELDVDGDADIQGDLNVGGTVSGIDGLEPTREGEVWTLISCGGTGGCSGNEVSDTFSASSGNSHYLQKVSVSHYHPHWYFEIINADTGDRLAGPFDADLWEGSAFRGDNNVFKFEKPLEIPSDVNWEIRMIDAEDDSTRVNSANVYGFEAESNLFNSYEDFFSIGSFQNLGGDSTYTMRSWTVPNDQDLYLTGIHISGGHTYSNGWVEDGSGRRVTGRHTIGGHDWGHNTVHFPSPIVVSGGTDLYLRLRQDDGGSTNQMTATTWGYLK